MKHCQARRYKVCRLSIAQQLFAVDPHPTGDFGRGGGALSFLLHDIDKRACRPGTLLHARKINELLLEYEEDDAPIGADLYVKFLEVLLKEYSVDDYALANWLAIELERDSEFLGIELWRAAVGRLSEPPYGEKPGRGAQDKEIDEIRQVTRELFRKREMFGVDLAQLYRFLHQATRRNRDVLAEVLVVEEPACVSVRLRECNNLGRGFARLSGTPLQHAAEWGQPTLVSLMLKSGADPNEEDENGNTALFTAFKRENRILLESC